MMDRVRRIEWWARLGYAARGLVYCVLGTAILLTGRGLSTATAVELVGMLPAGLVWLVAIGLGLFGYGLFRLYEAALDLEGRGDGWGGRLTRAGRALGGLGYWLLALIAIRTMIAGPAGSGEVETRQIARDVGHQPGGSLLLLAAGLITLGVAIAQARRAWRCDFWWLVDPETPHHVRHLGRAGFAARALIIALLGWFLVRGGIGRATEVRGFAGAIDALRGHYWMVAGVGVGLVLFGLFSFALARWRRIADEQLIERLRARWG